MSEENKVHPTPWMLTSIYRETGRHVKIGPLDGRLMIFLVLLPIFPSMNLLYICLFALGFFWLLDYKGYTLPNAFRRIHVFIVGKKKFGVHYWRQNKFRY